VPIDGAREPAQVESNGRIRSWPEIASTPPPSLQMIDWFYEHGKPSKAREILLQPWPGMDDDLTCFYQHLVAASKVQNSQLLFLKSCSFDDDGVTYQFPDWMIAAGQDLEGRYGQQEGRLRW
jgi:hypothetical protein